MAKRKQMTAQAAFEAVTSTEDWSIQKHLNLLLEFIDKNKQGNELFAFLEEKAAVMPPTSDEEETSEYVPEPNPKTD